MPRLLVALIVLLLFPAAPTRVGSPRRRSTARAPTWSRSATSTSPATAPGRSPTCAATAACRTCSWRGSPTGPGGRRSGWTTRAARRPRSSSRSATATGSRSSGSPTATCTRTSPAAPRSARGRSPARCRSAGRTRATWTSTSASTARPTRSGSRRATCAPRACRTRRGRGSAPSLDVDPALEAGTGALRPKVAVSAEGYAVATWGDRTPDGVTRVWARRLTGMNLSAFPQDLTIPGGLADSPDIDIEDDGSFAWVVFRQEFAGVSRTIGRRLVGSAFEPFEPIDGGIGGNEPRIDMTAAARATRSRRATAGRSSSARGSITTTSSSPAGGSTASTARCPPSPRWRRRTAATSRSPGGRARPRARALQGPQTWRMRPEFRSPTPALGPVIDPGVYIGGDRFGDFVVAMVQGTEGALALTAATYDRAPGRAVHRARRRPTSGRRGRCCAGGPAWSCGASSASACSWTAS